MSPLLLIGVLGVLTAIGFYLGRSRAVNSVGGNLRQLGSLPNYYGWYVAMWCAIPSIGLVVLWSLSQSAIIEAILLGELPARFQGLAPGQESLLLNDIRNLAAGDIVSRKVEPALRMAADRLIDFRRIGNAALFAIALALAILAVAFARRRIHRDFGARARVERAMTIFLIACSAIAVLTTIGIVLSLLFESIRFFNLVSITDFLFGLKWSPQIALREDQVGSSGLFGAIPLFAGTLLITLIAMIVAVPVGLMSAIYLSDYASPNLRAAVKPALEILAGVPTVVYGFFAVITVAPFFRGFGESLGLDVASESALAAGIVMGVMIIPFISSLSDDVMNAVPQSLRDGSYALGATRSETIRQVVLPAALPGIFAAVLLAMSRAIGETMIVVMAAGLSANLTANPLEAVTTVTVQIVTLLVGDQEFDNAKTLAAFALGLVLFTATLAMNFLALHVVNKYRERYD